MTENAHTPLRATDLLPISYRPDPMDDWGTIRAAPGATGADGVAWSMGRIRDPRVLDADLWKFRVSGTDPYEAVGKMFVQAVNSHHRLIEALESARDYVSDASRGHLTYEGSGEGFIEMAKEDLERIDEALKEAGRG